MRIIPISAKAQHGKDTLADLLKIELEKLNRKVAIFHYADYLKFVCQQYYEWDGKKNEQGRSILQKVGTDLARKNNPNIWVNVAVEFFKAFSNSYDYILIPDTRFPNEIDVLKENFDVTSIRLVRKDFSSNLTPEQKIHPSETALDDYLFDMYMSCLSGVGNVECLSKTIANDLKRGEKLNEYTI